jgi:C4-type Zn-finger protein
MSESPGAKEQANIILPLILCPECEIEMRLIGIESESPRLLLFTFECEKCGHFETRSVSTH